MSLAAELGYPGDGSTVVYAPPPSIQRAGPKFFCSYSWRVKMASSVCCSCSEAWDGMATLSRTATPRRAGTSVLLFIFRKKTTRCMVGRRLRAVKFGLSEIAATCLLRRHLEAPALFNAGFQATA